MLPANIGMQSGSSHALPVKVKHCLFADVAFRSSVLPCVRRNASASVPDLVGDFECHFPDPHYVAPVPPKIGFRLL
jgi:hypothetical protein